MLRSCHKAGAVTMYLTVDPARRRNFDSRQPDFGDNHYSRTPGGFAIGALEHCAIRWPSVFVTTFSDRNRSSGGFEFLIPTMGPRSPRLVSARPEGVGACSVRGQTRDHFRWVPEADHPEVRRLPDTAGTPAGRESNSENEFHEENTALRISRNKS